jgi:hypothetical protein
MAPYRPTDGTIEKKPGPTGSAPNTLASMPFIPYLAAIVASATSAAGLASK